MAFDPTRTIATREEAIAVAEAMVHLGPIRDVWSTMAVHPLAVLLYAASPAATSRGIGWVGTTLRGDQPDIPMPPGLRWSEPQWHDICQLWAPEDPTTVFGTSISMLLYGDARQADSIAKTMYAAIEPWLPQAATFPSKENS